MDRREALKILDLGKNFTAEDLKKAYKAKAKKYHPDVNKDADSSKRFICISKAFTFLSAGGNKNLNFAITHENILKVILR